MKPDAKTLEILRNIQTEIGAGMVLFPKSEADRAHNNACDRANRIISNYVDGFGLFQMTRDLAAKRQSRRTSVSESGPTSEPNDPKKRLSVTIPLAPQVNPRRIL